MDDKMDMEAVFSSEVSINHEDLEGYTTYLVQRKREMGMMAHVRRLSENLGKRPSASAAEIAAAKYIKRSFQQLGFQPVEQDFRSRRHAEVSLLLSYLMIIISVVLIRGHPILFFVIFFLGFFLCLLEYMGRRPIGLFQWRHKSKNVILKISPFKSVDKKVVIFGHLDTPKKAFYHDQALERLYGIGVLINVLSLCALLMGMITITVAVILNVEKPIIDALWYIIILLSIPSFLTLLFVSIKLLMRKYSNGANDDASGLAVLLNLAEHYSKRSLINTELWLVALGSEEPGSIGLKRFLRAYGDDLKGAFFIFVDAVGMSLPVYYRYEGMILPFRADKKLLKLAENVKSLHSQLQVSAVRRRYALSSAFWLMSRGKRVITISSSRKGSQPVTRGAENYHSVDPKGLQRAYDFIRYLVENIDRRDIR